MIIKTANIKRNIVFVTLTIVMFFFMFSPKITYLPLWNVLPSGRYVFMLISGIYFFTSYNKRFTLKFNSAARLLAIFLFIGTMYSFMIIILKDNSSYINFVFPLQYIVSFFEYFLGIYLLLNIYRHFKFDVDDVLTSYSIIFFVQSIIVLLYITLEPVKLLFDNLKGDIDFGGKEWFFFRGAMFSLSNLATGSLYLSVGAIISIYLFFWRKKPYPFGIAVTVITTIAVITQGRMGFLGIFLAVFLFLYGIFPKYKKFLSKKTIAFIAVFTMLFLYSSFIFYNNNKFMIEIINNWAGGFFNVIVEGKEGDGSFNELVTNHLYLPKSLSTLFFGDGIWQNKDRSYYGYTDSGYVRNILFYGIFMVILEVISFIAIAYYTYKLYRQTNFMNYNSRKVLSYIVLSFWGVLLISNIKSPVIYSGVDTIKFCYLLMLLPLVFGNRGEKKCCSQ